MKWCRHVKESHQARILLPDLGTDRVVFSLWYVRSGERVFEGDRVAEVLVPGLTFDVSAPATGVLVERAALPNDVLMPGQVLGVIQAE